MADMKQSSLFPTYSRYPYAMVKGEGSRLWDEQGKEFLDFSSGLAVTNLGHVPHKVKQKLVEQLDELWHVSNLFHIPNQEKVADLLTEHSCADAVFFCNSGAEANEAAIKLARRYYQHIKGEQRFEIVTFRQSFHGRTLATLTATGQDKVQEGFSPLPEGFVYAPYNDVEALESHISERTCAIMLEMVQAEGGVIPADPRFMEEVKHLCEKYDLLLIVDEVQTGMGRTGKLFAYEHYGIEPDIFTLAKGLGSGFPIGAMLGKEKLRAAFSAGTHGTTFGGTPIAMAVALATLEQMLAEQLPEQVAVLADYAQQQMATKLQNQPLVTEIRQLGLIIGIQCSKPVADLIAQIHERGLLVVPAGPNVIRLLPNFYVTKEQLDEGIDIICSVLANEAAEVAQSSH